jgi:hypothetical protein
MLNRRNLLQIGALSFLSPSLSLLGNENHTNNKSVIWVWLGGGPSQFETFVPTKVNVGLDDPYRSINGLIWNSQSEVILGGLWENTIKQSDKLVTVRSFGHRDSSHRPATHFMMSGQYNDKRAQTAPQNWPSHGSVTNYQYPKDKGLPSYVSMGNIAGDKSAWLGSIYDAFSPSKKNNLTPKIDIPRFKDRYELMNQLGQGTEQLEKAFGTSLSNSEKVFDISEEKGYIRDRYGSSIGKDFLTARRLVENGVKFVTINYGGWDMHSNIQDSTKNRVPEVDQALGALLEDIWEKGMQNEVMVVVTGEFGRTKLNNNAGRDHWSKITPLLISNGNYEMGRMIGESDKSYVPTSDAFYPVDLAHTVYSHLGIPIDIQVNDNFGRPQYLLTGEHRSIL